MKVRCSGNVPCLRCQRKREVCFYKPEDARVTVSQRHELCNSFLSLRYTNFLCSYLQSLQDRAREAQPSQPGPESSPHDTAGIKSSTLAPRDAVSNFQSDQSSQRSSDDSTRYHALARSQDGTDVTIQGSHPGRLPLSGNRTYPGDPHHQRLEIGSDDVGSSPDFTRNPLVDNGETFARDPYGKYCMLLLVAMAVDLVH